MIRKTFYDFQLPNIFKFINKSKIECSFFNNSKINKKNLIYLNKFNYVDNNTPKIIRIIKDDNNNNKIILENFDEEDQKRLNDQNNINKNENTETKIKTNTSSSKLKIFGDVKIETNIINEIPQKKIKHKEVENKNNKNNKENKVLAKDNEFNIFNNNNELEKESITLENSEELTENILNYNQFFSDYCRVYVKAGDGGNGSISVLKGPLFDQGIKCL